MAKALSEGSLQSRSCIFATESLWLRRKLIIWLMSPFSLQRVCSTMNQVIKRSAIVGLCLTIDYFRSNSIHLQNRQYKSSTSYLSFLSQPQETDIFSWMIGNLNILALVYSFLLECNFHHLYIRKIFWMIEVNVVSYVSSTVFWKVIKSVYCPHKLIQLRQVQIWKAMRIF